MGDDYVSFEVAKLLKEKGFDETVRCFYDIQTEILCDNCVKTKNSYTESIAAPTLQLAMKWLRENYEIFIQPNIVFLYPIQYFTTIFCYGDNLKTQQDVETDRFDTYEEACEAAIKYCLENLI